MVVTAPPPSQSKSPAASVIVVLPPITRCAVPAIASADASGIVTVPLRVSDAPVGTVIVFPVPLNVMSLSITAAPAIVKARVRDRRDGARAVERGDVVAAVHLHVGAATS